MQASSVSSKDQRHRGMHEHSDPVRSPKSPKSPIKSRGQRWKSVVGHTVQIQGSARGQASGPAHLNKSQYWTVWACNLQAESGNWSLRRSSRRLMQLLLRGMCRWCNSCCTILPNTLALWKVVICQMCRRCPNGGEGGWFVVPPGMNHEDPDGNYGTTNQDVTHNSWQCRTVGSKNITTYLMTLLAMVFQELCTTERESRVLL